MKQPKKLSLAQKKLISRCGLNPKEWMCKSDSKEYLCVVSKLSMAEKIINKTTLEVTEGKRKSPDTDQSTGLFTKQLIGN